ncbi:MAG: tyrosine-type recombinase/integrase, partial [Muribaculum sp.]|nr:tyrosine-type recombinase/integrase [Muribaculum sp.]
QQLSIRWEPQMQEIVNRHNDKDSDFLFPLIDSRKPDYRKQYLSAYSKLNRHLKSIGKLLGLTNPLTFHRSRHSWASIARENNVPLSVICEGMGHDSEKTTRIYLASLDSSIVDKANSDILKLLE